MIFICENEECSEFGVQHTYTRNSYKYIDGELVSNNAPCPKCGKFRKEVNLHDDIPLSEKNIELMRYDMSHPEQKREILKKRSHEHFKKKIEPYKQEKLNEAVSNFKSASK